MKNIIFILTALIFLTACSQNQLSKQETVSKYYQERDGYDYSEMIQYLNDSIVVTEGDYIMKYDKDSFYEVFKWDSIFQSAYKVVNLLESGDQVTASVELSSIRNDFLKNSSMVCQFRMSFKVDKISMIESLDCEGADWMSWQQERDSLVSWIKANQPELDGFINDMSMKGAMNYLEAIDRYQTRELRGIK